MGEPARWALSGGRGARELLRSAGDPPAALEVADHPLLLPGWHLGRELRHRHVRSPRGWPGRPAYYARRALPVARGADPQPGAADPRPGPARTLPSHAACPQAALAYVGGHVGADALRRLLRAVGADPGGRRRAAGGDGVSGPAAAEPAGRRHRRGRQRLWLPARRLHRRLAGDDRGAAVAEELL